MPNPFADQRGHVETPFLALIYMKDNFTFQTETSPNRPSLTPNSLLSYVYQLLPSPRELRGQWLNGRHYHYPNYDSG